MKVVLFSVLILIMVVQTGPERAKPSCTISTADDRRKTRKYSKELSTGDPFSESVSREFRELSFPKNRHAMLRSQNRRSKKRISRPSVRRKSSHRKPEPILNFRSPEQLQEYLFAEAGNAKHILRSGDPLRGLNNQPEGPAEYSRNSRGSDPSLFRELDRERDGLSHFRRRKSMRKIRYRPFKENERFLLGNDEFRERRRRPILIRPYDLPYLYPPWYGMRNPFYLPRIKTVERTTGRSTEKPGRELILSDDLVRLKQLVDELDAMSEEGSSSNGKSENDKRERERNETITDMKEKIDKVIIPMLNKISKDLNTTQSGQSMMAESHLPQPGSPKKTEASEGDGKKATEGEKDEKEAHMKHNFPCRIDGLWACTSDALHLNISTMPNLTLQVTVMSESPKKSSFITKDWAINGITLATTGGPFLLAAICPEKRKVANFIGQCRSCREEDIIFGLWTFSTAGKDCAEIFTSFETKMDVFKRLTGVSGHEQKKSKSRACRF